MLEDLPGFWLGKQEPTGDTGATGDTGVTGATGGPTTDVTLVAVVAPPGSINTIQTILSGSTAPVNVFTPSGMRYGSGDITVVGETSIILPSVGTYVLSYLLTLQVRSSTLGTFAVYLQQTN